MCIAGRSSQGRDRFQREKASGEGGELNGQSAGNGRMWKKGDDRVREGAGGREIRDNKKEQRRTYIPRFEPNVSSHRAGKMHFELSKVLILSLFVRVPKIAKIRRCFALHCSGSCPSHEDRRRWGVCGCVEW